MSWCGGRIYCEIYRQKKYCRRGDHAEEGEPCDCRHAKFACEVEEGCIFADKMCIGPAPFPNRLAELLKEAADGR